MNWKTLELYTVWTRCNWWTVWGWVCQATAWLDDQPGLSHESQQFCSDFPHMDAPLVSSENAEEVWQRCSSRLGGQRPGMDTDAPAIVLSLFPVIQPSVMYYSTQSVFWRFNFSGYMTHIVNWCVLSQFICWRTGVHIIRTNSPIDSNWCLGCQSGLEGRD